MGLFSQDVTVGLENPKNVIEKISFAVSKGKVNFAVKDGSIAVVGGVKLRHQSAPYVLERKELGILKGNKCDVFVFADKPFEKVSVNFFGGQHQVSLSSLKGAKAKFSIVGNAEIEIMDYIALAKHYDKTISKEEIVEDINNNYRSHLTNEIASAASRYITNETTEVTLMAALSQISNDVISSSRKTATILADMGLALSRRGISLRLNSLDETDEIVSKINNAINEEAIASISDARQKEKIKDEHDFEINRIRAENTKITENTENINSNGNNPVHITHTGKDDRYCDQCGTKVSSTAKFCPSCGNKLR